MKINNNILTVFQKNKLPNQHESIEEEYYRIFNYIINKVNY